MRYFLTFGNNYRVYWAWTKCRVTAPIGQIFRPNHQPDPASLWLVDGGGRIKWQYWSALCVRSVIIFNIAKLMDPRGAVIVVWRLRRLAVVCGRQDHGDPGSWEPQFLLYPVLLYSLYLPALLIMRSTGWAQHAGTRQDNGNQQQTRSLTCYINMSLTSVCRTDTDVKCQLKTQFQINRKYISLVWGELSDEEVLKYFSPHPSVHLQSVCWARQAWHLIFDPRKISAVTGLPARPGTNNKWHTSTSTSTTTTRYR